YERVPRLRLVGDALGQAQVPGRVLGERVRLQKRVLLAGTRLDVLPTRSEDVLVAVDQPLRVRNRVRVQRVGGDPPILTQRRRDALERPRLAAMFASEEVPLLGGMSTPGVVRLGDTVRRPLKADAEYVHDLLLYLERCGFDGAPRYLGVDERGR